MKNLLLGAMIMLMGTFALAGSLEMHSNVDDVVVTSNADEIRLVLDLGDISKLSSTEIENRIVDFIAIIKSQN